jgi:hypothetical protein
MWAALEVISMYQHGRPELDPEIERLIKRITTASPLLDGERQSNRDGYLVGHLIELVRKHGRLDAAYALDLWHQLIGLCQVKDHSVFQALDDSARKMIRALVADHPIIVWEAVARFFEIATPIERRSLDRLVGPPRHGFDGSDLIQPGILFDVPEELRLDWARIDPPNRIAFLSSFYPIFIRGEDGTLAWHPAISALAKEFGKVAEFRTP